MASYLDPGSGSYLFQLLIAAAVGGLYLLRQEGKRILGFLSRLRPGRKPDDRRPR